MNADEIVQAAEERIREIDAEVLRLAEERARLRRMLDDRDETPTRADRFGAIELPPFLGREINFEPRGDGSVARAWGADPDRGFQ